ncbi:E1 ubiquitin-activating protein uba2 [Apophysomyces ossiformis]|uniref:Ubiquitin-activating enzyme E1-like n=1 Tax=Apophysomyces ossiformis TaxID=679940 RepID=A0A8H7BX75_9FUNG|nr:E1 ubiquitin-activating protein uba2 [Apophysomyces ossiformis]
MTRERYNQSILGKSLYERVSSSRVLLVGAGGIGCELLKNLVLSGFKSIEVIDLDTIDISNLNRQFLFQKQHVKKAKAHVAKESALKFNQDVSILSQQANIKDKQFSVDWFKQFTLVFNALDNLDARRHVNQMCLAADVPLIESGTTGYLGQAYVIKKDVTECFDCQPKPTPTTFPVCTIRSTPSAPIHCIVWAKSYLFSQLFGNSEEEDALVENASEENAKELEALARETEELKKIKAAAGTDEYARMVFEKVFVSDINRLLEMKDMWKNRSPPTPLDYDSIEIEAEIELSNREEVGVSSSSGLTDQNVWPLWQSFDVFRDSLSRLSARLIELQQVDRDASLSFDKDDEDAMDFVTATSNMRAHIFGIDQKSRFDVKSMAGNIIPAIATTNAIIAGVAVMKSFAVLNGEASTVKRTYLTTISPLRPQLLMNETPSTPNPECAVCCATSTTLKVDLEHAKLSDLMDKVIKKSFEEGGAGMSEDVAIMEGNRMIYDIDLDENLELLLKDLGVRDGTILRVAPDEGGEIDFIIQSISVDPLKEDLIQLSSPIAKPKPKKENVLTGLKRDRENKEESPSKKAKLDEVVADGTKQNDAIEVKEDENDGTILID